MKPPEATLELGDERFRVTSDIGSSEIEWSIINQIWRFENIWLLFFSAGEFMTLPVSAMSNEAIWETAEPFDGPSTQWMSALSKRLKLYLGTSFLKVDG